MRRPHLFEFIDQPWYPAALRDLQTDALQRMTGPAFAPVAPLIEQALRSTQQRRVIDLCSGGGGPWKTLLPLLDVGTSLRVTLTDRYPNRPKFESLEREFEGQIDFMARPVQAESVPHGLPGMRTMFSAFHHFPPGQALAVLRNARDAGVAIGVFDVGSARTNTLSLFQTLAFFLVAPLLFLLTYFVLTPKLGPMTWPRFVFTYLIPIVALVTCWDFLATALRAYTRTEMEAMVSALESDDYTWVVHELGTKQFPIFAIVGSPG